MACHAKRRFPSIWPVHTWGELHSQMDSCALLDPFFSRLSCVIYICVSFLCLLCASWAVMCEFVCVPFVSGNRFNPSLPSSFIPPPASLLEIVVFLCHVNDFLSCCWCVSVGKMPISWLILSFAWRHIRLLDAISWGQRKENFCYQKPQPHNYLIIVRSSLKDFLWLGNEREWLNESVNA